MNRNEISIKKNLIMELASSSCLANRERIWELVNEIGQKELEKDKEFSMKLIEISIRQIGQICRGERSF